MSRQKRFWLRFLLCIGQRKSVVMYLRYRGLTMRDVATRYEDLEGMLS